MEQLPDELKIQMLGYAPQPRSLSIAIAMDQAYILQEIKSIEPDFNLEDVLIRAYERQNNRNRLQQSPAFQIFQLIQRSNRYISISYSDRLDDPEGFENYTDMDEENPVTIYEVLTTDFRLFGGIRNLGFTVEEKEDENFEEFYIRWTDNSDLITDLKDIEKYFSPLLECIRQPDELTYVRRGSQLDSI